MRDGAREADLRAGINKVDELRELARHLQPDSGSVDRSAFDELQESYLAWYRSALALADPDLRARFRSHYEAEETDGPIRRFLRSGHQRMTGGRWTYPVDQHYLEPLSRQKELLLETLERLHHPIPSEAERGARITKSGALKAAAIGGTAVVLAAVIANIIRNNDDTTQPSLGVSPSASSSPTPSSSPSFPTVTPPSSSSTPPHTPSQPPITTYVDSLKPQRGKPDGGTMRVNRVDYPHALTVDVGYGCLRDTPLEYLVPDGARQFHAIAGIADNSGRPGSRVKFAVYLDGRLVTGSGEATAGFMKPQELIVAVKGAGLIKLEAISLQPKETDCHDEPVAVWGDPVFG